MSAGRLEEALARLESGEPHEWKAVPGGRTLPDFVRYECARCGSVLDTGHKPAARDWRAPPCDEAAVQTVMES